MRTTLCVELLIFFIIKVCAWHQLRKDRAADIYSAVGKIIQEARSCSFHS